MMKVTDKMDPGSPVILINAGKSGIEIEEARKRKERVSAVMYNMKGNSRDAQGTSMILEAQEVYDGVRETPWGLGFNFVESKETNI